MSSPSPPSFEVRLTDEAKEMLRAIARSDRRIASKLTDLMEDLRHHPDQKGFPLGGELTGLISRHAIGNRFRIIYGIDRNARIVSIISVGLREEGSRRDIYAETRRILRRKG